MSDSEDLPDITTSLYDGSSGNEANSEGESYQKDLREITELMNYFNPTCLSQKRRMFRVLAQAQKANLRKLNLRDKMRQGLQILTGVFVGIVKTKKGKLTAYVAKKLMLSTGFFTSNKLYVS